jgi:hypothetical protein
MVSYSQKMIVVIVVGLLGASCTEGDKQGDGSVRDSGPAADGGCTTDEDGGCADGSVGPESCPVEKVLIPADASRGVSEPFCMDIYESSRENATATSMGEGNTKAISRPGVMPWQVGSNAEAQTACEASGKTLCSADQWYMVCSGPDELVYSYGNEYHPTTCNGIDKYGSAFRMDVTGANLGCTNSYGVLDMNGNIWEHILGGDNTTIRGGAYNCGDSETYHRCDYIPGTWSPLATGFRCCKVRIAGLGKEDFNSGV